MRRSARLRLLPLFRSARGGDGAKLLALPDGQLCFRILDVASHVIHHFFQRVRSLRAKIAAGVAVGVDVRNGVLAQIVAMVLHPFR